MLGVWQPHAVFVMGSGHAQTLGVLIHHLRKHRLVPGDMFGQGHTGIVAGLHNHAFKQILH